MSGKPFRRTSGPGPRRSVGILSRLGISGAAEPTPARAPHKAHARRTRSAAAVGISESDEVVVEAIKAHGAGDDGSMDVGAEPIEFQEELELSKEDLALLQSVQQHFRVPGLARGVVAVTNTPSHDDDAINEELPRPKTASGRDAAWSDAEVQTTLLGRALVAATAAEEGDEEADVWQADNHRARNSALMPKHR